MDNPQHRDEVFTYLVGRYGQKGWTGYTTIIREYLIGSMKADEFLRILPQFFDDDNMYLHNDFFMSMILSMGPAQQIGKIASDEAEEASNRMNSIREAFSSIEAQQAGEKAGVDVRRALEEVESVCLIRERARDR